MSQFLKILLIGPFPDPVGGVSMHLSRLKYFLENVVDVLCVDESPVIKKHIFNIRSLNLFKYFYLLSKISIVHIHSSVPILRFFNCTTAFLCRKKIVITLHSFRRQSRINRLLNWVSLRLADRIIAVSTKVAEDSGFQCDVIPAFIKPTSEEIYLDSEWRKIITKVRSSGKKLAVSNAYKLDTFCGKDLYGFDQIIKAFNDSAIHNDWCVILVVSTMNGCEDRFVEYQKNIAEHNLEDVILLFNKPVSFCGLLTEADLSIRATLTDGDALSVRESLLLNVKTVASDCVARPVGTILYETSNVESLKKCILSATSPIVTNTMSFERDILSLYKGLL